MIGSSTSQVSSRFIWPLVPRRSLGEAAQILYNHSSGRRSLAAEAGRRLLAHGVAAVISHALVRRPPANPMTWNRGGVFDQTRYSPEIYRYRNRRNFFDTDATLFGMDPFYWFGLRLGPEETTLGRLVERLPTDAVVSDWGGGAGLFARDLKKLRSDLKVFVVDLYPPEEIPSGIQFLRGDACQLKLPDDLKSDLIFSVEMSPYVDDPLALLAHLYNQLQLWGVLVVTFPRMAYDVSPSSHRRPIFDEIVRNLVSLGIKAEAPKGRPTLVIRRQDRREMKVAAKLVNSLRAPDLPYPVASFYEPGAGRRWLRLEELVIDPTQ